MATYSTSQPNIGSRWRWWWLAMMAQDAKLEVQALLALSQLFEQQNQLSHAAQLLMEVGKKVDGMATWQPVQLGRGQKQFDHVYRRGIYSLYSFGVPRSAVT